jgi:hypothetical protein
VRSKLAVVLVAAIAAMGICLTTGCAGKKDADKGAMAGKTPEEMKAAVKGGATGSGAPPASATKAPK